ncbi:MAG: HAMP domain-containing histidine kinase [Saprospiraceae bacterium]|nr:HAMP domain-containing histidine kinase [Saprospiraceae bacterium]
MASHEFRTPLSTILSSASLSVQYTQVEQQDKREKHFEKIKSAVTTLTGILNDFLSLSRLEEGRVEVQFSEIDFGVFSLEIAEEMNPLLKQNQHIFIRHTHAPVVFKTDKNLLKLIFFNLLSNASKYSDEGAEIHCVLQMTNDMILIDITDEGIGIPESDKPYMFERFFSGFQCLKHKRHGLRFEHCETLRRIIERHYQF